MSNKVSICIIAKNEEKNIQKCLRAITPLQCEIILTDTGSTDKTVEIASQYTDHIYHFDWCDDFSAARNFCVSRASNDWILQVDCDEYLVLANLIRLREVIKDHPKEIGLINRISPYPGNDVQQKKHEFLARLYDRNYYSYQGNVQEHIEAFDKSTVPTTNDNLNYFEVPLTFYHDGFKNTGMRKQKAERDLTLLQESLSIEGPSPYIYFQMGKCYVAMNDPALAAHYFDLGLSMNVNPSHTYVHEMVESYGFCLLDLKQYDKALSLENLYDIYNNRADFVFLMGLIYMNNARFQEAIKQFEKATKMNNYSIDGVNSYAANYNIGLIYESMNEPQKAIEYYTKCGNYPPAIKRISVIR
ncbi:glycosyltransferase family 2 protein [Butyrivibrio sp. NC3005]|uniref:glycosyltransferase family 2 protein n=1 Tax=Butyrivibrio sp. NC3005 TaxID=1280685 RepID=UPI0003FFD741|nr:glycosyltransferase family 2 protein [Butyrivibrio sp. NC3005]